VDTDDLRKWIQDNMTVDEERVLSDHKDKVARLLGLTPDGRVFVKVDKTELTSTERVALYLVGKVYSRVVGYSPNAEASNEEIARELGMPDGTVRRATMELRDIGWGTTVGRGIHRVVMNALPNILTQIDKKSNSP
jgi:hypothetical protein